MERIPIGIRSVGIPCAHHDHPQLINNHHDHQQKPDNDYDRNQQSDYLSIMIKTIIKYLTIFERCEIVLCYALLHRLSLVSQLR